MSEINRWTADQCGVQLQEPHNYVIDNRSGEYWTLGELWTIEDPRCREIVREHFHIATNSYTLPNGWGWHSTGLGSPAETIRYYKTITEAEIACITAIWEAQQ